MAKAKKTKWEMSILVPAGTSATEDDMPTGEGTTVLHSKGFLGGIFGGDEKPLDADETQATARQWTETVTGLLETVNDWSTAATAKWKIDEVVVGLTLSAEGKLLFIAKGSAEASIEIKLKYVG